MPLSTYRMDRIYLSSTMNCGLGSDDPEVLAYYNKIKKEITDMKKNQFKKGVPVIKISASEVIKSHSYPYSN